MSTTPSISPWRVGQLTPTWTFTILDDDGNVPIGLPSTGISYTVRILNKRSGAVVAGQGTWVSINTATGVAVYQLVAADVPSVPSKMAVWLEVAYTAGPLFGDTIDWTVTAS